MSTHLTSPPRTGRIVSRHPVGRLGFLYGPLSAALLAAAGIGIVLIWMRTFDADPSLTAALWLATAVLGSLGLVLIVRFIRFRGASVVVHELGFAHTARGATTFYPWHRIRLVTVRSQQAYKPHGSIHTWIRVRTDDERTLRFTTLYADAFELGLHLLERSAADMLPGTIGRIDRGETIDFGALRADARGLTRRFGKIEWRDIGDVSVKDGRVVIRKRKQLLAWGRPYVFQVENVLVFLGIVQRYARLDLDRAPRDLVKR